MADGSEDPRDIARMEGLERTTQGIVSDLEAQLALARSERDKAAVDRTQSSRDRSETRKVASEAKNRKSTIADSSTRTPDESRQLSSDLDLETAARKRVTQAAQLETAAKKALHQENILLAAQNVRDRSELVDPRLPSSGGGSGPPPPPPPRPTAQGSPAPEEGGGGVIRQSDVLLASQYQDQIKKLGLSELSAQQLKYSNDAEQAARSEAKLTGELSLNARAIGLSDNAYRQHGALTTEFIEAAAKGQTTFHELGYQVGATIGKFAGWTAAASAVYGALGAVTALGKGALDAASGVEELNRYVTTPLTGGAGEEMRQFGELARTYNVPINDVVESVAGMAKVFGGDLPQAFEAARTALGAVKVGELTTTEATDALTAIVNGLSGSASDLAPILDSINQAQQRFGGNTGQLTQGVAKGIAIFKSAGGTYREYIALLQAGSRLTGAKPTEVSTALSRGVSRQQTPAGQEALRNAGLDPSLPYVKLLQDAQEKAKNATPDQVQQLARAFIPSGAAYARILVPLLKRPDLIAEMTKAIGPEESAGSVDRELASVKRKASEEIAAVGVNLQALGAALSNAGALNGLGAFLGLLNKTLSVTTDILDALNSVGDLVEKFPIIGGAIHAAFVPLLEAAVVLKGLRRLDVGASLPVGQDGSAYSKLRSGLQRRPDDAFNAQIGQGVGDERKYLENLRKSTAQQAAFAGYQAERSDVRRRTAGAAVSETPEGSPERLVAQKNAAAAQENYERRVEQSVRLSQDQADLAQRINTLNQQDLEYQKLRKAGTAATVAAEQAYGAGALANPSLNRPVPLQPIPVGQLGGQVASAEQRASGVFVPAGFSDVAAGQSATAAETRSLAARGASLGISGRALGTAAGAASTALIGARAGIARAGAGMAAIGTAALGPLDAILALGISGYEIVHSLNADVDRVKKQLADRPQTSDPDVLRASAAKLRESHVGLIGGIASDVLGPLSFVPGLRKLSPRVRVDQANDAEASARDEQARNLETAQKGGSLLTLPTIKANLQRRLAGAKDDEEIDAALEKGRQELAHGYANVLGKANAKSAAKDVKSSFDALIATRKAQLGDLDAAVSLIKDLPTLKAFAAQLGTSFSLQGGTAGNFRASAAAYKVAIEKATSGGGYTAQAADFIQQAQEISTQAVQEADKDLQKIITYGTPAQQRAGRTDYLNKVRGVLNKPDFAAQQRDQQRQQFDSDQSLYEATTSASAAAITDPSASAKYQLDRINARVAAVATEYGKQSVKYQEILGSAAQEQQQLVNDQLEAFTSQQAVSRSAKNIGANDQQKLSGAVNDANAALANAKSIPGVTKDQIDQAVIAVNDARGAYSDWLKQNAADLADARVALAESKTDDPVKKAQIEAKAAQAKIAQAKTPVDRIKAEADANEKQRAAQQATIDAKSGDIDYDLSIEKIDRETAISKYEALLKTIKNNQATKRQITQKIHDLKAQQDDTSGLELNLGDIKLPTAYEIRRAVTGGLNSGQTVQQTNHVQLNVQPGSEMLVGEQLDRAFNSNTRGALRASGVTR